MATAVHTPNVILSSIGEDHPPHKMSFIVPESCNVTLHFVIFS